MTKIKSALRIILLIGVACLWAVSIHSSIVKYKQQNSHDKIIINSNSSEIVCTVDELPESCENLIIAPFSQKKYREQILEMEDRTFYCLLSDESCIDGTIEDIADKDITNLYINNLELYNFEALSHMENLNSLHYSCRDNTLSLNFSGTFPSLTELDINTIITDVGNISSITGLKNLDLSETDITDISSFSTLTEMEYLNLSHTGVDDISSLSGMTKMKELRLDYTNVYDISAVRDMQNIELLSSFQNLIHEKEKLISDVSPLAGKDKLRELYLYGSDVSDITPLSNLPNLEKLELSYTPLESLAPMYTMPKLKEVAYYHCDSISPDESNAFGEWFRNRDFQVIINGHK